MDKNTIQTDVSSIINRRIAGNNQKFEVSREKIRPKRVYNQIIHKKRVAESYQCRICLVLQAPGIYFTDIDIPKVKIAFKEMYGISVRLF